MANIIDYYLYVKGPSAIADLIASGPFPRCYDKRTLSVETLSECDGIKTVAITNDSPSDAPIPWVKELVAKYHDQGVRFFMFWLDADNWDYQSDPVVNYRFGEVHTAPSNTFKADSQSVFSDETGFRGVEGPITMIFNRSQHYYKDSITEVLLDGEKAVDINDVKFTDPNSDEPRENDIIPVRAAYAAHAARKMARTS